MEFLIGFGILWALGAIFGKNSDRPGTGIPQTPIPRRVPPPSVKRPAASPAGPTNTVARTTDSTSSLKRNAEAAGQIERLFGISNPLPANSIQLDPATLASLLAGGKKSWQEERGGVTLHDAVCPAGIGEEVLEYLGERGIRTLYHFTDRKNIDEIIRTGGLYSWDYLDRAGRVIPRPGSSESSRSLDKRKGLENYVRLSFVREHPMMYKAKSEGRISDPIILEVDVDVVRFPGVLFSDRNAVANNAKIRPGVEGLNNLRFDILRRGRWNSEDEKALVQAEVLVSQMVPGYLIRHEGRVIRKNSPEL